MSFGQKNNKPPKDEGILSIMEQDLENLSIDGEKLSDIDDDKEEEEEVIQKKVKIDKEFSKKMPIEIEDTQEDEVLFVKSNQAKPTINALTNNRPQFPNERPNFPSSEPQHSDFSYDPQYKIKKGNHVSPPRHDNRNRPPPPGKGNSDYYRSKPIPPIVPPNYNQNNFLNDKKPPPFLPQPAPKVFPNQEAPPKLIIPEQSRQNVPIQNLPKGPVQEGPPKLMIPEQPKQNLPAQNAPKGGIAKKSGKGAPEKEKPPVSNAKPTSALPNVSPIISEPPVQKGPEQINSPPIRNNDNPPPPTFKPKNQKPLSSGASVPVFLKPSTPPVNGGNSVGKKDQGILLMRKQPRAFDIKLFQQTNPQELTEFISQELDGAKEQEEDEQVELTLNQLIQKYSERKKDKPHIPLKLHENFDQVERPRHKAEEYPTNFQSFL